MDSPLLTAQHYRDQAEKVRRLASGVNDMKHRAKLLEVASGYERLAVKYLNIGRHATRL